VKKSRALSTPPEVDENDNEDEEDDFVDALEHEVPIPSPRPSPPHETKDGQIPHGTDDISQSTTQDRGEVAAASDTPDIALSSDAQPQIGTSYLTPVATTPESHNQPDTAEASSAGVVNAKTPIGESGSVDDDNVVLPPTDIPSTTEEVKVPPTTTEKSISQTEGQPPHEADNQTKPHPHPEMGTDCKPRDTKRSTPPLSEVDGTTKRPREDEDGDLDPNPRGAKRASPPPEKEKEKEKKERPMRKKSGSDAHAPSAPASPRSKPVSAFVGRSLSGSLLGPAFANMYSGWWWLPCVCRHGITLRGR